jgi:hypothetical protein
MCRNAAVWTTAAFPRPHGAGPRRDRVVDPAHQGRSRTGCRPRGRLRLRRRPHVSRRRVRIAAQRRVCLCRGSAEKPLSVARIAFRRCGAKIASLQSDEEIRTTRRWVRSSPTVSAVGLSLTAVPRGVKWRSDGITVMRIAVPIRRTLSACRVHTSGAHLTPTHNRDSRARLKQNGGSRR